MATAHSAHRTLVGPALATLLAPVPPALLRTAVASSAPAVLAGTAGDARNALLTLARILVTLDTGELVSKDVAAERVAASLGDADRTLLHRARSDYLHGSTAAWDSAAVDLAHSLARRIDQAVASGRPHPGPGQIDIERRVCAIPAEPG